MEIVKCMTKEQLAELLNGREYRKEISKEEIELAKENRLVVVFGASDDLMELEGAISEEFGTEVYLDSEGNYLEGCGDDCTHSKKAFEKAKIIEADYTNEGWRYKTEIPHATFDIMEEGELYCRGIVFSLDDLK